MKTIKILISTILLLTYGLSHGSEIDDYIQYLSKHNLDIQKAELNYKQAQLNYNGAKIDQHPSFSSMLSTSKTENNPSTNSFTASLSYDLDLWGQLSETEKSKFVKADSMAQTLEDTKHQVVYKFIDYYLQLSYTNEKINLENDKLKKYSLKLNILEAQYKNNYVTADKVLTIKNSILDIENNLLALIDQKNNLINNLNVLLNQKTSESILTEPASFQEFVTLNKPDSDILSAMEQNPLIKASLLNIISTEHVIKYNEKSYYPTISLNGSLTDSVLKISNLLNNPILTILSSIKINFNYNEIQNNIDISKVNKDLATNSYQSEYIALFNNIKETITKYQNAQLEFNKVNEEYKNHTKIMAINETQYKNGYLPYNTLLDAEISLVNIKEAELSSQLAKQQMINKLNYYIN